MPARQSAAEVARERDRLRDFAEAGPHGWKFHERSGDFWAGREFDYPQVGERILLSIQPNDLVGKQYLGQVRMQLSAGAEATCKGDFGDVAEWLTDWDSCLSLPLRITDCRTYEAAITMLSNARPKHLANLGYLLDVYGTLEFIANTLVEKFAPRLARSQA